MKRIILGPLVNLLFRPWVKGLDNIPESGPAVLVSNHLSFSDSIFLPLAVPRPVVFLAKSEYFSGKGIKGKLTAAFFRLSNQLPMDRSGGAASATSLSAGEEILKSGGLLGIYPEGTRSPDGRLYRGKTGVAKLILATGVPVIPVAMIGTDKVQPIGRRIPNIRRIGIIVGEPMDFRRYAGMGDDRFIQRSVTDEIMYALMRLSGQEYVDVYASSVKERLAGAAKAAGKKPQRPADPARQAAVRLDGTVPAAAAPPSSDTSLPPSVDGPLPGEVRTVGRVPEGTAPADAPANEVPGDEASGDEASGKTNAAPAPGRKSRTRREGESSTRAV